MRLNGIAARADDLRHPALTNYGHFTSMQVVDGCVRGLDLHLERLARATLELFGHALDVDQVHGWMRAIVGRGEGAMSLRVNVFSRALDRDRLDQAAMPDVLLATAPVRTLAPRPLRVRSVRYQREAPHIKHVGTFGLFHQKRLAQLQGFDDALFVDATAAVSEGTIWNVGFFERGQVVWPDAAALDGISMQLLKAGLRARGVSTVTRRVELAELASFRGAFFTNSSCVACPIACIDDVAFATDAGMLELLAQAMDTRPWQRI